MCTLILAHRVFDDAPLFLASNRDERLDRPSSGPELREVQGARIVAPRDELAGGTWLGVNEWGVVAAITNRFGAPSRERRSRGFVVLEALRERSAVSSAERVAGFDVSAYNPFHLTIADAEHAEIVWSDGEQLRRETLEPGFTVVTERSFGAAANGRADRLQQTIDELRRNGQLTRDALVELLRFHRVDDVDAVTVEIPEMRYGTRSSTVLAVGPDLQLLYADGPPHVSTYEDQTSKLRALLSKAG